jgi:hypothetical protein
VPPIVTVGLLEEIVWADIRGFIEDPGGTLSRIRDEIAGEAGTHTAELERRRDDYAARLVAKQAERTRYVEIAARNPDLLAERIDAHLADLRTQADNLEMLLVHTDSELAQRRAQLELADTTEAWLRDLKGRIHEVEGDTEEHFFKRRQLVQLLVSRIVIEGKEEGEPAKVRITYRFDSPAEREKELCRVSRNSNDFLEMKRERDASPRLTR